MRKRTRAITKFMLLLTGLSGPLALLAQSGPAGTPTAAPAGPAPVRTQRCDNKLYGIAALRRVEGHWEDDCRTIHEFRNSDLSAPPKVHRRVLPFQSYALAQGFDNCLYSVTKAPTNAPEYVYRYDPATRRGAYTRWQLPAQGEDNIWISAATDEAGNLCFQTSDASQFVQVDPFEGTVKVLWTTDPIRRTPYYKSLGFAGAGTHGNFCLDDANTMYMVYSTNGSLLKVDLRTRQPAPAPLPLTGLPARGGYSDVLLQNDEQGRRRLYLAGPQALYRVDLAKREARLVRRGVYTDLAGCNLFPAVDRPTTPPPPVAAPPPPTPPPTPPTPPAPAATWQGRVLHALTRQPLPRAQLQLLAAGSPAAVLRVVPLGADGRFSVPVVPGRAYPYRALLSGYLTADSAITTTAGGYGQNILLRPLAVGTTLALENVRFTQGQTALLPSSFSALDRLLSLLQVNPRLSIELRGHTDNVGDPAKNMTLSEQRVEAVKAYLVGRGVAAKRISGVGLGGAQPAASNGQESTRRLNRRVEFRVTGI